MYPKSKTEAWWVVVGDKKKNTLLAIKRVTLQRKTKAKLEFAAPDEVMRRRLQGLFYSGVFFLMVMHSCFVLGIYFGTLLDR